ncbi:MAG: beta-lactamase family protein [candidate division Zixibacteria bacterium]|nr:beta-lactamase family protein [candidate division Zixibacteria bacterium]
MRAFRNILLIAIAVAACVGSSISAQLAETLEEERAIAFLKKVQAGDKDSLLAFMYANWIPAAEGSDREARWQKFATLLINEHSDLQVAGVMADEPHRLEVMVSDPDGPELVFIFDFEAVLPHLIRGVAVDAGGGRGGPELPDLQLPPDADDAAITAVLDQWFGILDDDDIFSGTVLIARDGVAIYRRAWGKADLRWEIPNRIDTRFDLGSINKSFTRIAIGQLIRDGKLGFGDLIITHLPDYPNTEAASKITIRHLLEHTAGLGDIFNDRFFTSSKAQYRSPRDFFPLFADKPLQFDPGSRSEYSNAGFMVLGAIIEAVSGQPYDEYVVQNIFEPAGMTHSGFFDGDGLEPNVAEGYTTMQGDRRSNIYMLPARGNSAGSAQSTVDDLLAFDNALREYRLLPPYFTNWYFGGVEPEADTAAKETPARAAAAIGIAGGAPGVSASLESDGVLTVIVLSNYDAPIAENVARVLYRPLSKAFASQK